MKHTALPNLGAISNGLALRTQLAAAISYVERQAVRRAAVPDQLVSLRAFLQAGIDRLDAVEAAVPEPEAPEGA